MFKEISLHSSQAGVAPLNNKKITLYEEVQLQNNSWRQIYIVVEKDGAPMCYLLE